MAADWKGKNHRVDATSPSLLSAVRDSVSIRGGHGLGQAQKLWAGLLTRSPNFEKEET